MEALRDRLSRIAAPEGLLRTIRERLDAERAGGGRRTADGDVPSSSSDHPRAEREDVAASQIRPAQPTSRSLRRSAVRHPPFRRPPFRPGNLPCPRHSTLNHHREEPSWLERRAIVWRRTPAGPGTGSGGAPTSPNGSGARCGRTTRNTATAGATCRTTTPEAAPTDGVRTGSSASPTARGGSASRSRSGTGAIRSSRSGSSVSPGPEGNHGEDVKELYYYLDSTPTHSYLKALYKYPQAEYPYESLVRVNRERGKARPRVRAARHRRLRREPLLRRLRRVRQGRRGRHPGADHRRQPRPRDGHAPPAPDPLVPQHLELGARGRGILAQAGAPPRGPGADRGGAPVARPLRPGGRARRRRAGARARSSPTTRPTPHGSSAPRTPSPT